MRWKRDLAYGIILMLISIFLLIDSTNIASTVREVSGLAGPALYLRIWVSLLFIFSAIMTITALVKKDEGKVTSIFHVMSVFTVVALVLYALLIDFFGYLVATTVTLLLTFMGYTLYSRSKEGKKITFDGALIKEAVKFLLASFVVALVIQTLFAEGLNVLLPQPRYPLF